MRTLEQAGDIRGKTIFLRADFDVPVVDGVIGEQFRIERQKECLQMLLVRGARVVIGAHISAVPSFKSITAQLEGILGVTFGDEVTLLENLRSDPGEESNDRSYAHSLIQGCDLYVNNAFAVCHRAHASVATLPALLPSYAGPLLEQEVTELGRVLSAPEEGMIVFMGGAKASTKVPVIKHLINRAQVLAVGGVVANDILAEHGEHMGSSRIDHEFHALLEGLDVRDVRLQVPEDFIYEGDAIMDIGPRTRERYQALTRDAKLIVWNGPMGKFEDERYGVGTRAIAEAVAASDARTIVGGGDTIAAIHAASLRLDQFGFVSTGGGAMLSFLAEERLPGLATLEYHTT